jgi:CBS domain containing-hemolysin-like protein
VLTSYALTPLFEGLSPVANFLLQTVCLTFLILLFGEIFPKLMANSSPIRWARFAAGGVNYMMNLFWPISSMMVRSTKIVNKVITKQSRNITADELGQALEIADVSNRPDKEMLQGIHHDAARRHHRPRQRHGV